MQNRIEKGDKVKVTFASGGYFDDIEGVVDYTPCAEGDSWVLVQDDGRVIYVQRFETMILLSKPNIRLDGSHINPLRRLDQQAEASS